MVVVVCALGFCTIEAWAVPTPPALAAPVVELGLRRPDGEKPAIVEGECGVPEDGVPEDGVPEDGVPEDGVG